MTLKDVSHGPDWVLWVVFATFVIISIILLSGRGANLIAGYNTAPEEEKRNYDAKKASRTVGVGMSVITVLILVGALFESVLPASSSYVFLGVVLADCVLMILLLNTVCRKKDNE